MSEFKWRKNKCTMEMISMSFILVVWTLSLLCCVVVGTLQDTDYQMEDAQASNFKKTPPDPKKCGNGVIDSGEDCDCGQKCIRDPCCQSTCQFKLNAQCSSHDPCCSENCLLQRKGSLCRNAKHICDIGEYCTGNNSTCPSNSYKRNGANCTIGDSHGVCFSGTCLALNQPCTESWVTTDTEPIRDLKKCPAESICVNKSCIRASDLQHQHSCPTIQGLECSGHGDCSNRNTCVCHPGWTGSYCDIVSETINSKQYDDWPGRITEVGPDQKDSTSDTIALAGGLVAFVLTVSIIFVCMACRFLPTRAPKDEITRYPAVHVETIDPDGSNDH